MVRIKKSYRKKALELHPDRNYGNIEAATRQFADVQAAYEILSDPQERAWYDSHRDAILLDGDNGTTPHHDRGVRVTTAANILSVFTHYHGQLDYSDAERGFFSTVRNMFDNLAVEERESYEWDSVEGPYFPGFGTAKDAFADVVKPFYNTWSNFSTNKSFSWEDRFRTTDAPDRRVRRMMEKENKKFRDEAIREFNEAVRSLVAFVKKRDPRYEPTSQSEVDRQKALRDATAAQAARSRAANQANLDEQMQPEWTKADPAPENVFEESSEGDQEEFECIICSKVFKSEKQWQAHERSKKHLKAAQRLRREIVIESEALGLEAESCQGAVKHGIDVNVATIAGTIGSEIDANGTSSLDLQTRDNEETHDNTIKQSHARVAPYSQLPLDGPEVGSLSSDTDDVYTSRETSSQKANQNPPRSGSDVLVSYMKHGRARSALSSDPEMPSKTLPKVGKAKEKRARKAMRENEDQNQGEKVVSICMGYFDELIAINLVPVHLLPRGVPIEDTAI